MKGRGKNKVEEDKSLKCHATFFFRNRNSFAVVGRFVYSFVLYGIIFGV